MKKNNNGFGYLYIKYYYDSYVNLSRQQYNDVINLSYKFAQENDMEVVPIDLQLSEDKQERTEQFNQVYSFCKNIHILVLLA